MPSCFLDNSPSPPSQSFCNWINFELFVFTDVLCVLIWGSSHIEQARKSRVSLAVNKFGPNNFFQIKIGMTIPEKLHVMRNSLLKYEKKSRFFKMFFFAFSLLCNVTNCFSLCFFLLILPKINIPKVQIFFQKYKGSNHRQWLWWWSIWVDQ